MSVSFRAAMCFRWLTDSRGPNPQPIAAAAQDAFISAARTNRCQAEKTVKLPCVLQFIIIRSYERFLTLL